MTRRKVRQHGAISVAPEPAPVPSRGESEPSPPAKARVWKVRLYSSPTLDIEAADGAEAWEKYKAVCGILGTENVPVITEVVNGVG